MSDYTNFLISGYGRSGTKFLSSLMDRSNVWAVGHEPGGASDECDDVEIHRQVPDRIQDRFNRDNYGEVNSRLRWIVDRLDVNKKGIIIRHPADVWISTANRKNTDRWQNEIDRMVRSYDLMVRFLREKKAELIRFPKMTSDVDYLNEVIRSFGIEDVTATQEDVETPKNRNSEYTYTSMDDFSSLVQARIQQLSTTVVNSIGINRA